MCTRPIFFSYSLKYAIKLRRIIWTFYTNSATHNTPRRQIPYHLTHHKLNTGVYYDPFADRQRREIIGSTLI